MSAAHAVHVQCAERDSISFVRDPSIYVVSFDGRKVSVVLRGTDTDDYWRTHYSDPAWSRDGRRLAVTDYLEAVSEGNDEVSVDVVRPPSQKPRLATGSGWQPSWAPDGLRLVFVTYTRGTRNDLEIWNSASSRLAAQPAWKPA